MFEHLVQDVSSRTGLGQVQANDLLRAVTARLLHNPQGGFAPFLATLRDGGKGDVVASWLGEDPKAGAISPDEAEAMLGADYVDETSRALGISRDEVRIGSAVALPSVAHELTPGGMVPAADELERGYAGWAGGHLSVGEAPIGGFPTEPSGSRMRVEMDLARPAPEIKAKAFDGVGTLLPWFALFVALPVLSFITCNANPAQSAEHGSAHETAVSHEERGTSPSDAPATEAGSGGPEVHGSTSPEAGNAAVGNTAAPGTPSSPIEGAPGESTGAENTSPTPGDREAAPQGSTPANNAPVTNAP